MLVREKEEALNATKGQLAEKEETIEKMSNMTNTLIEKLTSEYRDERMQLLANADQNTQSLLQRLSEAEQLQEEEKKRLNEEAEKREAQAREEARAHAEEIKRQQDKLSGLLAEAKLAKGGPYINVTVLEATNLPKVPI